MNEEINLAIEEFRQMPPGQNWLIPIRFDAGIIPKWSLGAGETLSDLNYVDLFGEKYTTQATTLVAAILRLMGTSHPSPETTQAAVAETLEADRVLVLRQLTKEMLLDPARRIELDGLVSAEVGRIVAAIKEFPVQSLSGTPLAQIEHLVTSSKNFWSITAPFCASLQVSAQFGTVDDITPWVSGIKSLVAAANRAEGGVTALLQLRSIPALAAMTTASLACSSANQWANLRRLVADTTVRDRYRQNSVPIIELTTPYTPFDGVPHLADVLVSSTINGAAVDETFQSYSTRGGNRFTAVAEWLHHILRAVFENQIPDDDSYDVEYDRAEIMMGLISQDAATELYGGDSTMEWRNRASWFGRSTWRAPRYGNALEEARREFEMAESSWGPLAAGLFKGDKSRADMAFRKYSETFNELSRRHF